MGTLLIYMGNFKGDSDIRGNSDGDSDIRGNFDGNSDGNPDVKGTLM